MPPGASVVPSPERRTGSWLYVAVDSDSGRMHCWGEGCHWSNSYNKTRAKEHLTGCTAAKRSFPEMMGVISYFDLSRCPPPPATTEQLHEWRLLWVEAMCESCLPLSFFETASWRAAIMAVSFGRFAGPGDRRVLASTYVPLVAAKSDSGADPGGGLVSCFYGWSNSQPSKCVQLCKLLAFGAAVCQHPIGHRFPDK